MLSYYKLRVDVTDNYAEIKTYLLSKVCQEYAFVYEGKSSDNLHVHWYIKTVIKEATIRSNLRKLGLKGNGSYSLKELDEEYPIEYFAYMFKEGNPEYNVPEDVILRAKEHNIKVVCEIAEKKASKKKVLFILEDRIREKHPNVLRYMPKEIVPIILQYHIDNGLLVSFNRIVTYVETLMLRLNSGPEIRMYTEKVSRFMNL